MLTIRLQRVGRRHEPVFRLVLTDSKNSPKSGKFLKILGSYDARRGEKAEFKMDEIKHWIDKGAKTSDTVHNLLVDKKIIEGKKINKLPRKTVQKVEENKDGEKEKSGEGTAVSTPENNSIEATAEIAEVVEQENS